MIGIYKITNKINGKCYIGQSIDIKRRWSQHKQNVGSTSNPMYLDFKKYGLDNFDFEVLEECDRADLDEKEIAYIAKFNSYNEGYNLTIGGQRSWPSNNTIEQIGNLFPKKFTSKQWLTYYYILLLSFKPNKPENNSFSIGMTELNIAEASRFLGISSRTIHNLMKILKEEGLIEQCMQSYFISTKYYRGIDFKIFSVLLGYAYRDSKYIDLVRLFIIFNEAYKRREEIGKITFTKRSLIRLLDHNENDTKIYSYIDKFLNILQSRQYVIYDTNTKTDTGICYTTYELLQV